MDSDWTGQAVADCAQIHSGARVVSLSSSLCRLLLPLVIHLLASSLLLQDWFSFLCTLMGLGGEIATAPGSGCCHERATLATPCSQLVIQLTWLCLLLFVIVHDQDSTYEPPAHCNEWHRAAKIAVLLPPRNALLS